MIPELEKCYIYLGAKSDKMGSLRVSQIALNLLRNLPSARDAVFEYYAGIAIKSFYANFSDSSYCMFHLHGREIAFIQREIERKQ